MTQDLAQQQTSAQREATRLAQELAGLEGKLSQAVANSEFAVADQLKAEIADTRTAWVMAEAQQRAIGDVLAQLAAQEAERAAAEALERRREEARAVAERATVAEQEAMAALRQHWADVEPGLTAVRESMLAAVAAEDAVTFARRQAYEAMVTLGDRPGGMRIYGPTDATARIEQSRILTAIFHNKI